MKLGEIIENMTNSDRLIVQTETGEEIYRGYVANFVHCEADREALVKRHGLATDIFMKKDRDAHMKQNERTEMDAENISDFKFSDLEMLIYTRVIVTGFEDKKIR